MTDGLKLLRQPFPPNHISKLPKPTKAQTEAVKADFKKGMRCNVCGTWHHPDVIHLDYVGHAALTDRLLDADPNWQWEPLSISPEGLPVLDPYGGMWIKLTVCGVTRLGYGHAGDKQGGDAIKEIIGDALRNAAMRFGAALDLWHKGDLHAHEQEEAPEPQAEPSDPAELFTAAQNKLIREAARAAIELFGQGREWGAYEEVTSCVDRIGGEDEDRKNLVRMALWKIFGKSHSALRTALKRMDTEAHEKDRELARENEKRALAAKHPAIAAGQPAH